MSLDRAFRNIVLSIVIAIIIFFVKIKSLGFAWSLVQFGAYAICLIVIIYSVCAYVKEAEDCKLDGIIYTVLEEEYRKVKNDNKAKAEKIADQEKELITLRKVVVAVANGEYEEVKGSGYGKSTKGD